MGYLLIRHTVEDYARWKAAYDEHEAARKAGGSQGERLFRNADDPNEVVALIEWDDLGKARQFTQSEDLRQVMQRAGVSGRPDLHFLEAVESTPA